MGERHLCDPAGMASNTSESIIMARHPPMNELAIVLRAMFSAGADYTAIRVAA